MLSTVSSGPDTHCDTEQVLSLSWVSVSQPVKGGHQYVSPKAAGQEGGSPGSACEGFTKLLVALSQARASTPPRDATNWCCGPGVRITLQSPRKAPEAPPPRPRTPARPPPSLEPRPPSDGGAAPGNGTVATQRSCDPTLPRRPRRLSQTTRRAPAAAAGTATPGPSLGHLRPDGADCAARNPGGHGDLGRASGREPSGASGLRSGRRGGGGHDLGVEAPAARGQAGRQVPVCGLLP